MRHVGPARMAVATRLCPSYRHLRRHGRNRLRAEGLSLRRPAPTPPEPCPPDGLFHGHALHRIVLIRGVGGQLRLPDGCCCLRRGDAIILPAGRAHAVRALRDEDLRPLTVAFAAEHTLTVAMQPLWDEIAAGPPVIHCRPAARAEAERLVRRIRCEQHRERRASSLAVRAYLLSLLVLLYRRTPHAPTPAAPVESALSAVAAHMESHYPEPLHVEDLAARAHLSPRQFVTRFKRAYGETPARHLTRLRIAAAQELLRSAPRTIADIARDVGYESLSHFYRTFLQSTGVPPGRYRQLAAPEAAQPPAPEPLD